MPRNYVLIGAGSVSFTRGLVADILRSGKEVDLGLVDVSPEALAVAEGLVTWMVQAAGAPVRVKAATDRRHLLPAADAVICTVGVGGRRAWERDVLIPRQFGIYQPVGDTTMPGGLSRALRMIPAMVAIAEDVLDLCPDALFFNYGNPMTAVCRGIRKATGAHVVGLCHGVIDVARFLARFIGVPLEETRHVAAGVNHLTWFTEFRHQGRDAWPRVRAELARRLNVDVARLDATLAALDNASPAPDALDNPFSWQLFALTGAFPAVLDRHVSEFFPQLFRDGSYFGRRLGVDAFSFEQCVGNGDRGFERMRAIADGSEALPDDFLGTSGGEHEQVIDIIDSIETDAGRVYSANLPNAGQVGNLPLGAVIESPAVADASGLRPIAVGDLPSGIAATVVSRLAVVETIVDAALAGNRDLFVQALVADGSVDSLHAAQQLADALLEAHSEFLPRFASE